MWLRHERTGNLAPIDVREGGNGNVLVLPNGRYCNLSPLELLDPENAAKVHTNHFQVCPQASDWKNGRVKE